VSRRRLDSDEETAAVVVIGAGASGVAAARAAAAADRPDVAPDHDDVRRAARRGAPVRERIVLVGETHPGGGSRLVADGGVLLDCATRGLDWHATLAHLRTARAKIEDRCRRAALHQEGIDLVSGRGSLVGNGQVMIESRTTDVPPSIHADRIILATGDEVRLPEITGLAETRFFTATTILRLGELPPSIVVLGGGPTGCELAQAFARFGVQTSIIEAADRLLPREHSDASDLVTAALREDGVRVFTRSRAVSVAPTLDGGAWVGIASGGDVAAEGLVIATGRRPAVQGLGLEQAGAFLSHTGWVRVDDFLATTGPGILAVGRVTGLLPHGATDRVMARVAGQNAVARRPRARWSPSGLPRVVRTSPAVGSVGVGPAEVSSVPGARVSAVPMTAVEPAILDGTVSGLVSLVAGPATSPRRAMSWSGRGGQGSRLLGAGIVGPHAGELAGLVAVALRTGMTVEQLADAPLSSRTWAAAVQHAATGFATRPERG
jgi:pyruvate/2-oxoglutarate dehydrogenase complex dihydrolipoamide dehydrogenase (E3) component